MRDNLRPLRELRPVERLLVKLRRCPTCHKKLGSVPQDQIANWSNSPGGMGTFSNSFAASSFGRSRVGHVTQFRHGKVPHCPGCQYTFIHGWIYPNKQRAED